MRDRRILAVVGVLALSLIVVPGCVSGKRFSSSVEDTDSRVAAVENAVESNQKSIADLKSDTDRRLQSTDQKANEAAALGKQALAKAEGAEQSALGKLLWTVTITDDQVKFPFGNAELESDAISKIDVLVSKIKDYGKAVYLEIEGHTDSVGDESYNDKLSTKRAMAVRNYLHDNGGVPFHAMSAVGMGESKPIADNSSKEGRAQNRRVVIRVLE